VFSSGFWSIGLQFRVLPGVCRNVFHQLKRNTGTAWIFNQLWSSHPQRFVPELRCCWLATNKRSVIRCIRNIALKYPIVYLTWRWPVGAETCSEWRKIKKGELTYWNFVAIDGVTRNQLGRNLINYL
jgi:hypothetical protein